MVKVLLVRMELRDLRVPLVLPVLTVSLDLPVLMV